MPGSHNDHFLAGSARGALPLLIWAAHFFVTYVSIKSACALDLQRLSLAGVSAISLFIWLLSAVAIGALVWLVALGVNAARSDGSAGTLSIVRAGAAILALAGVLWSSVPIALVPPCANAYDFTSASAPFNAVPSTLATWVVR